jgi:DNA helicase HerA-like ATPase
VTKLLRVSPDLSLPLDAATETFAILGKRGAGKSNTEVVMAEEFSAAGIPFVTIDPKGDWWGIRSSADGKSPGLSVPVFGGRHGDVPLEATAGPMLADLILWS